MKKILHRLILCSCVSFHFFVLNAAPTKPANSAVNLVIQPSENIAVFTPPTGWNQADAKSVKLPPRVKVMVVGKGPSAYPPSMNLSSEVFQGTLKQYLQIVKRMNDDKGYDWKDLGTIRTQAGNASLSQVDTKSQWGDIRLMHVILLKNGTIYILTASALKNEFSLFYQDFFKSMRSLRIANDFYDTIPNAQQRNELKAQIQKMKIQWKNNSSQMLTEKALTDPNDFKEKVFHSDSFQSAAWQPFIEFINRKYVDLGSDWQAMAEKKVKDELFALSDENTNSTVVDERALKDAK